MFRDEECLCVFSISERVLEWELLIGLCWLIGWKGGSWVLGGVGIGGSVVGVVRKKRRGSGRIWVGCSMSVVMFV